MIIKINGHEWCVEYANGDEMNGATGRTYYNDRTIYIRKDVDAATKVIAIRHELTHAILCSQGRWFQDAFNSEDVCEFIAWNWEQLETLTNRILVDLA